MRRSWWLALVLTLSACGSSAPAVDAAAPDAAAPDLVQTDAAAPTDAGTTIPASDGGTLEPVELGEWHWLRGTPIDGFAGRTASTLVAYGPEGAVWRWTDGGWAAIPVPTPLSIRAAVVGADELWASDEAGKVWRRRSDAWSSDASFGDTFIGELERGDDGSVWAYSGAAAVHGATTAGAAWLRTASGWQALPAPPAYCLGGDYFAVSATELWSAGLVCTNGSVSGMDVHRWTGASWSRVGATVPSVSWFPTLERVAGRMRACGFEWNGTSWVAIESALPPQNPPLDEEAIPVSSAAFVIVPRAYGCTLATELDGQAWCAGEGRIAYRGPTNTWMPSLGPPLDTLDASQWGTMPPAVWAGGGAERAWGSSATDVYRIVRVVNAIGEVSLAPVEHFDGATWAPVQPRLLANDVSGSTRGDVWFATADGLVHFDGTSHSTRSLPRTGTAVRVDSSAPGIAQVTVERTDANGSRFRDVILRWDGTTWSTRVELTEPWSVLEVANVSPNESWLLREWSIGRDTQRALDHHAGATSVEAERFGPIGFPPLLARDGNDVWLAYEGSLRRVSSSQAAVGTPSLDHSQLWVGAGSAWLFTHRQAVRRALP